MGCEKAESLGYYYAGTVKSYEHLRALGYVGGRLQDGEIDCLSSLCGSIVD